jgi:hypothetical protein
MHTPGTIYAIDFDGTVVTHEFPKVGKDVPYAVETLQKIVAHGGKLILWTMRSNRVEPSEFTTEPQHERNPIVPCDPDAYLDHAIKWFADRQIPLWGIQRNPDQDKWTSSPKAYAHVYIDDAALGTHTMQDPAFADRPYVDWVLVDNLLFPEEN